MSLNSHLDGGSIICLISTISGCRKSRSNLISRKIRIASDTCSKLLDIFFIATFSPVCLSMAAQTTHSYPFQSFPEFRIYWLLLFLCSCLSNLAFPSQNTRSMKVKTQRNKLSFKNKSKKLRKMQP